MNFSFLVEFGFAVGFILGCFVGSMYRTLMDKWKFRNSKPRQSEIGNSKKE